MAAALALIRRLRLGLGHKLLDDGAAILVPKGALRLRRQRPGVLQDLISRGVFVLGNGRNAARARLAIFGAGTVGGITGLGWLIRTTRRL